MSKIEEKVKELSDKRVELIKEIQKLRNLEHTKSLFLLQNPMKKNQIAIDLLKI